MAFSQEPEVKVLKCPQCGAPLQPSQEGFIVCQYCGSTLIWSPASHEDAPSSPAVVRGIHLKQFVYTDAQGTGLEVFRMLAPAGWQIQGGCRWLLDNPGMPAVINIQIFNPQGPEAFEILPNLNFVWINNPMALMMFPVGSRYFGAEVRPPLTILEAFHHIVLPRYRASMANLQILKEELQPDLPRLVKSEAMAVGGWAEGAKVRVRYTGPTGLLEEDLYGVVEIFRAPLASAFGVSEVIFWWVDYLFSFRTASGRLDATAGLFSVMIKSFRLNPEWYAAYKSIIQVLAQQQIQRIRHIGQISEIYARTGREIREQNLRDWYARQEVYDRLATEWSRATLGLDAFLDPYREEIVELPAGYGYAWANGLGEYILTNDSSFNPNLESTQNWEPMKQT